MPLSPSCPEPVYGLAVIGTCRPEHICRNADVLPGDALILTKPLGVGIYWAAIKKRALPPEGYSEMIATPHSLTASARSWHRPPMCTLSFTLRALACWAARWRWRAGRA
jgi:selenide,water dikinase